MSYHEVCSRYKPGKWDGLFDRATAHGIERAISAQNLSADQFAFLLSKPAGEYLEPMALAARKLTEKYFGKTIQLYTPIYLSNYCDNHCVYCGFNAGNKIDRKRLSPEGVEKEAALISSTGLKHVLVLTGESREMSPPGYIKDCVKILGRYFSSISIEVYPLAEEEYRDLISEGVDGLTIYQEVYDEDIYGRVHPSGPKSDYLFRLDSPERGARAGMRSLNIGTLFGLNDWRREIFLTGLHAKYLQDKFPDIEIGAAIPRIKPHEGSFKPGFNVADRDIVQAMLALRIFLPRLSLTVSTRENGAFRENMIPLGITRMSAGSTTRVGGHTSGPNKENSAAQFEISDERSVGQIVKLLRDKGYQPVLKDWMRI